MMIPITQVMERQYYVCHGHFDQQYCYQKKNGAFLLECGAVPKLNLTSGSDMSILN